MWNCLLCKSCSCYISGVDEVDYSRYPSKDFQLTWLRNYLQAEKELQGVPPTDVLDRDVERLYVQANKFALVSYYASLERYCMVLNHVYCMCSFIWNHYLGTWTKALCLRICTNKVLINFDLNNLFWYSTGKFQITFFFSGCPFFLGDLGHYSG